MNGVMKPLISAAKGACAVSAVAACLFGAEGAVAQTQWNMAASWGGGPFLEDDAKGFAKLVENLTGGSVKVQVFPGGTLGKPGAVSETVESGAAQIGHTWPGYDWGIDRAAVLFAGTPGGLNPEELILVAVRRRWGRASDGVPSSKVWRCLNSLRFVSHGNLLALQATNSVS